MGTVDLILFNCSIFSEYIHTLTVICISWLSGLLGVPLLLKQNKCFSHVRLLWWCWFPAGHTHFATEPNVDYECWNLLSWQNSLFSAHCWNMSESDGHVPDCRVRETSRFKNEQTDFTRVLIYIISLSPCLSPFASFLLNLLWTPSIFRLSLWAFSFSLWRLILTLVVTVFISSILEGLRRDEIHSWVEWKKKKRKGPVQYSFISMVPWDL